MIAMKPILKSIIDDCVKPIAKFLLHHHFYTFSRKLFKRSLNEHKRVILTFSKIDSRHAHSTTCLQAISTIPRLHPHQSNISPDNCCRRRVRERGCVLCVPHVFSRFPSCHPGSPSLCVALSQTLDSRHIHD